MMSSGGSMLNVVRFANRSNFRGGAYIVMRKFFLLIALVALGSLLLASAAFAGPNGDVPGEAGPDDTRAIVSSDGQNGAPVVTIMFTPAQSGTVTYAIYKHQLGDGRKFNAISSCTVVQGLPNGCGPEWGSDKWANNQYTYVTYRDSSVAAYQEYYYYVSASTDPADANLNKYVVASAFPPTQNRHGNYSEYTNACTACHGLHSSKAKKLLKGPTVTDLCGTCHDGTGSKYDEVRGRVRLGDSWADSAYAAAGPFGDRLKQNSGVQLTSAHNVMRAADNTQSENLDETQRELAGKIQSGSARIWMAPGSGWLLEDSSQPKPNDLTAAYVSYNWGSWLVCSSCHEPHNRAKNYRILRGVINDRHNIVVRGVSEVDPSKRDASPDRGVWEDRAMYTKFLSGGNSTTTFYDPHYEDPVAFASSADAQAACTDALNGGEWVVDPTSPTGGRCKEVEPMGGVTTFCTACHRAFVWHEARIARDSYSNGYSGWDTMKASNTGTGPLGYFTYQSGYGANGMGLANYQDPNGISNPAKIDAVLGQHKHPINTEAMSAWEEGKLIDGPVALETGDICKGSDGSGPHAASYNPSCEGVGQTRVQDPIVPLEGFGEQDANGSYQQNLMNCLSCHVPHGSGSERIEVAYKNNEMNDSSNVNRDSITGYLWNRYADNANINSSNGEPTHPNSSAIDPRYETQPKYWVNDTKYWTQFGVSSVLARFNPMASACYRCHSVTRQGWK